MSKNIAIQEGGTSFNLTVDRLQTALVGGGSCLWVPEDETVLGEKTITEDGTYKAANDGVYGYSQVTVRGIGTVSGKDAAGNDAVAKVDPETGQIVIEELPSVIKVTTPPTNPYGIYQDGQTISTEGMEVMAYLATGGEYGDVPIAEISIDPTTAVYDPSTDTGGGTGYDSEIPGWPNPFGSCSVVTIAGNTWRFTGAATGILRPRSQYTLVWASDEQRANCGTSPSGAAIYASKAYTKDGKTVYYGTQIGGENPEWITGIPNEGNDGHEAEVAWAMIYGESHEERAGSHQEITVTWPRPGDGKTLSAAFEILVAPGYGGED